MTRTGLSDLDRRLARGPRLVTSAILGAGVGAVVGWLAGRSTTTSMGQGAVGGVVVGLLYHGYEQWSSVRGHEQLGAPEHLTGILAPYPFYSRSVTYPWSAH
jgi:hypothetical protein